ncbi:MULTISPECIES: hypothetical protein [Lacrimispora]|uniref:Uncharacterized protein n=1 Tax=Lacrimispora xylanolytica TaxID=29375 RepID=A0ABY7AGA6_9FIRM|nr:MULTISPECIES: hypothetical protein [Lacrimispora]MBS5957403.1 hypothetical protein [Clostridiales bacterium]WAJ24869.1 hypothetical protein OW255_05000 [Lacrimispora xylanolytica]
MSPESSFKDMKPVRKRIFLKSIPNTQKQTLFEMPGIYGSSGSKALSVFQGMQGKVKKEQNGK